MTIQAIQRCLQTLRAGIRHAQAAWCRSVLLTANPALYAIPPVHWRDYDIPTFKRRGIRLSIAQETARH